MTYSTKDTAALLAEAETLESAATTDEARAEIRLELGRRFADLGDDAAATGAWRSALALRPDWPAPYVALGRLALTRERWDSALAAFANARDAGEDSALVWRDIARAMLGAERWAAATSAFRAAVTRDPTLADAWNSLGQLLRFQGKHAEASEAHRRAADSGEPTARAAQIETLLDLGRLTEAETLIAPMREAPDHPSTRWLSARRAFLAGDLVSAWKDYEGRFYADDPTINKGVELIAHPAPRWRGEDLDGKRIALLSEQGHGDVLQFVRYARELRARGAHVSLVLKENMRGLARLMSTVAGLSEVVVAPDLPIADFHVPLLSVPHHLGTTLATIPPGPYLKAPAGAVPPPLRERRGKRVGIVWAGDPDHRNDHNRSASLETMLGLASVRDVRLFSLQLGPRSREITGYEAFVADLSRWIGDFSDTAAIMGELDLVIAVDTSVVHLAGALGRPVWVAIPFVPDWRWMLAREDSPWYPSMRLFRQAAPGNWHDVFAQMARELSQPTSQ